MKKIKTSVPDHVLSISIKPLSDFERNHNLIFPNPRNMPKSTVIFNVDLPEHVDKANFKNGEFWQAAFRPVGGN